MRGDERSPILGKGRQTMTKRQSKAEIINLKGLLTGDQEYLRKMVETIVQATLEAEMTEAVGAEKSERTPGRVSYRSGYYSRGLITRVGTLELRVPQDRRGRFRQSFLNGINGPRRRWWRRSPKCTFKGCPPVRSRR